MEKYKKAYFAITKSPSGKHFFYLELEDEIFYAWNFTPDESKTIESQLFIVVDALLRGGAFREPDYYGGSALHCYILFDTMEWEFERDVYLNLPWREVVSNA